MFDNIKNMASLLGQAKQFQENLESVQKELARKTVEADAGAGAVRVVVNGGLEIVSVHLDRPMLATLAGSGPDTDQRMVEDLIAAATNAALTKAREMIQQEVSRSAGGMDMSGLGQMLGLK